jgi:hypothetical protein
VADAARRRQPDVSTMSSSRESRNDIPEHLLARGFLELDRHGHWHVQGEPVTHPRLIDFLWRHMRRNAEGEYWVENGPQRVLVKLQDAPYVVRHLHANGTRLMAELSDGSCEPLDIAACKVGPDHVIYTTVKRNPPPGHRARLSRAAVAELEPYLVERPGTLDVIVAGQRIGTISP